MVMGPQRQTTSGKKKGRPKDDAKYMSVPKKTKSAVVGSVQKELVRKALEDLEIENFDKKIADELTQQQHLKDKKKEVALLLNDRKVELSEEELQLLNEKKEK